MPERRPSNDHRQRATASTSGAKQPMLIDVLVREPQRDSPTYTWDHERNGLRLAGLHRSKGTLPADLATFCVEGPAELPVLLLHSLSLPPETHGQARLLGALSAGQSLHDEKVSPADGWVFVAVAVVDASLAPYPSIETLPATQLEALKAYLRAQTQDEQVQRAGEVAALDAEAAARLIRETRLYLKREQRARPRRKAWSEHGEEERPVAWRAVEGLSEALRLALQSDALMAQSKDAPHAHAEQLIRFVPQRFQQALAKLLLDDEYLLAFVERPLLRHRTGLLGMQNWRFNEGLFLVTDRQALWLRDFLTPGSTFAEGGYIARMVPLERLNGIAILPPGRTPGEFAGGLEASDSPYQRLVLEVASSAGTELIAIEFPVKAEVEKALAQIAAMLRAFLPMADGNADRRLRRLPAVDMWLPQGAEAERLRGLGGFVPPPIAERLERRLAESAKDRGEEVLVSALVPALEDFKSPARLVALTRQGLIVVDDGVVGRRVASGPMEQVSRYDLRSITSAQLRYSLLGSGLSLFVPQHDGRTQQVSLPFNSPAIAWFLPLFIRLRLLLSGPYRFG